MNAKHLYVFAYVSTYIHALLTTFPYSDVTSSNRVFSSIGANAICPAAVSPEALSARDMCTIAVSAAAVVLLACSLLQSPHLPTVSLVVVVV